MPEGRSYTTTFKTDTSGFKKGMDEMVQKLNEYNKALVSNQYKQRDSNKAISEAQSEIKKIIQSEENRKKKIEELNKKIEEEKQRIEELNKKKEQEGKLNDSEEKELKALTAAVNKSEKSLSDLVRTKEQQAEQDEKNRKRIAELNNTIEEETVKLSQLKTEQASIRNLISETTRTLTDNNNSWTVLKGTLANLTSDTLQKLGSKLKSIVSDVIHTGESFSASMSEVGAISGATAEELQQLEDAARLYGSTTRYSAAEAADALKYMALAGWNAQQSIEGLPAVLNLAAASGMDLGKASDIVTDYITAFGLSVNDAARLVDIMSFAMSNSNTTTEMLGEAYKNCAATAHSMGITVEEVTAALMTMANAGVKGGEAGTTLNTLMTRLATDTKGCATQLKEFGVEIYDLTTGKMNSLSKIMVDLSAAWDSLDGNMQRQAELAKAIAGTNQYAGFQTLMQGMSKAAKEAGMSFEDYTAALESCDGAAQSMAKTMSDNLSGDIKAMESAFDELKLKIFEDAEQPLRNIVQLVTDKGIPTIEEIIKHLDAILPVIVGCAVALATLKLNLSIGSVIVKVVDALKKLKAGFQAAESGAKALSVEMKTLSSSNVIGLVITAVVSLGSAMLTAAAANAELTKEFEAAAPKMTAYIQQIKELNQSCEDHTAAVAGEQALLEIAVKDYEKLSSKTSLTKDEQSRLAEVSKELASKLGFTTQQLEAQKVSLEELKKASEEYIKSLETKAIREYYEEIISQSAVAKAKVQEQVESSKKEWQDAEKELDELKKKFKETYGKEWDPELSYYNDGGPGYKRISNEVKQEINSAIENVERLKKAYWDAQAAWNLADADAEAYTQKLNELNKSTDDAAKSTEDLHGKTKPLADSLEDLEESTESAEKKLEDLAKETKTLQTQSTSLRSEMNSLANSMKQLESGEALSLSTLLDLIDKYPEYAAELSAAAGNADLQKQALEKLFEAKKNDYILTQQAAIDNIEASNEETRVIIENTRKQMQAYEALAKTNFIGPVLTGSDIDTYIENRFSEEYKQIEDNIRLIDEYQKKIEFVRGLKIGDFGGSGSSGSSSGSGGSTKTVAEKEERNHTYNYKDETYTTTYSYNKGEYDAEKDTDAEAKAYIGVIDRAKQLGKVTLYEEINNLKSLLEWEKISADQRYEIRLRLYKAQEQLAKDIAADRKDLDEKAAKAAEEAANKLLENQKLALAAYNRLVEGRIEQLDAEGKAAQENADKQIAAIDAVMQKRKEEQADAKRQKELDRINAKLQYQQMSEFERMSLERRKQDILNEQAEVSFERMMEGKKSMITGTANAIQNKNAQAIAGLQAAQTQAADRMAYLQGSQTYDQRVKNNSVTQNLTIVQNGMSDDQALKLLANKIKRELGAVGYGW